MLRESKHYGVKPCLGVKEMATEQIYFDRWEVHPESILWFTCREVADAGSATLQGSRDRDGQLIEESHLSEKPT
jgi:hypothetical protein